MESGDLSVLDLLITAGWPMVPIYLCSLVAVAVLIRKLIEFRTARVADDHALIDGAIAASINEGNLDDVVELCNADGSPLASAMAHAARTAMDEGNGTEEEVIRHCSSVLRRLRGQIPVLSFIAQVAPLFGLLGTVIGMVELFAAMEAAGHSVDTSVLASGIWKALLTTAAGLIVAIPALGGHAWLTSQVEALRQRMEDGTGRVLHRVRNGS